MEKEFGEEIAVIITDTQGRAFRFGAIGTAIGCSGISPLWRRVGEKDLYGRELETTEIATADAAKYSMIIYDKKYTGAVALNGYGAAIGAKMGCPGDRVIHITGDGSFHMNLNEACTAVTFGLPVITIIFVRDMAHAFPSFTKRSIMILLPEFMLSAYLLSGMIKISKINIF